MVRNFVLRFKYHILSGNEVQVISVGGTKADQYHTWSLPTIWHWYNMRFKRWHFFSSTVPLALKLAKLASFKQPVWSNSAITSPDTNSPDEQALMAAKKRRRRAISQCSSQWSWPPSLSPPSLPLCMSRLNFNRRNANRYAELYPQLLRGEQCQQPNVHYLENIWKLPQHQSSMIQYSGLAHWSTESLVNISSTDWATAENCSFCSPMVHRPKLLCLDKRLWQWNCCILVSTRREN